MRSKVMCVGLLAALSFAAGCKQQCFVTQEDLVSLPSHVEQDIERNPKVACEPIIERVDAPETVIKPDRPIRYMSLAEAVSIALEQGTIGANNFPNITPGAAGSPTYFDNEVTFAGRASLTDAIRVLALDPAVIGANIELSLAKFDAIWSTSASWTTTDRPIGTSLDVFQAGAASSINTQNADVRTAIFKGLPTGGVAGITFDVPYTLTNLPSRVNPAYQPSLQFAFEQPLLQGFGVEINQLRQQNPNAELIQNGGVLSGLPQPGVEGILITRLRFDQERAEFQRLVNFMLANVEFSYWNLYGAYWNLYAQEAGLRQSYEAWKIAREKLEAGKIAIADLAQTRGQYELFRHQRLQALDSVLEAERQLRGMLGMHAEDGHRLVPSDAPTLAAFEPDWRSALEVALTNAPSLIIAREEVKANQLNLRLAENAVLPDLRAGFTYDINSIGSRLDGADPTNAFRNLSSDHFNNWSALLRLNVPIGYRSAHANVRIAKLNLARSYESLKEQELKIERALAKAYREVFTQYEDIKMLRAQREAFGEQVKARFQEFQAGKTTLDLLLEAQRFWAAALQQEYQAINVYNNSLAALELVKGTIAQHDNVAIVEGQLPGCVAQRAVEHQRQRSAALELRERAVPVPLAEVHADQPTADVPQGANCHAAPLPDLWQTVPPLQDAPALAPVPGAPAVKTDPTPAAAPKKAFDFRTPLPTGAPQLDLPPTPYPQSLPPGH
jgi:outer membrane protein TolC